MSHAAVAWSYSSAFRGSISVLRLRCADTAVLSYWHPAVCETMAYSAENGRDYANGGSYRQQENYYTQEDAAIVDKAKRTHKETTQSAQRALEGGALPATKS